MLVMSYATAEMSTLPLESALDWGYSRYRLLQGPYLFYDFQEAKLITRVSVLGNVAEIKELIISEHAPKEMVPALFATMENVFEKRFIRAS